MLKKSAATKKLVPFAFGWTYLCLLAITLALFVAGCATNFELKTEVTPVCTPDEILELERVVDQTQGVKGQDPVGYFIADFPAEKFGVLNINNWYPLSGYKETLCGELHRFDVYDGFGAEMDWNHFMIPAPAFEYLITDALPYKGGSGTWCLDDDWHSCAGENDCLEGELTPDETFYENPWFPKSTGNSVLEGRQICMYGAWIRECVHGHRPEIHTAELTWWKETWGTADLYWLMALQDDSNRFDDTDEFDIEGTAPPEWRPWAAAPMTAKFQLAFVVDPAGPVIEFEIGEAFARNVVTRFDLEASRDADDGADHAIEYNGQIVLRANENQPEDMDLGVTFTDVCRRMNGTLQGYVTLTTKTGIDNNGKEGYHILFVTANEQEETTQPVAIPELKAKAVIITRGDPASMRPEEIERRAQIEGDLEVEVAGLKGASRRDITIAQVHLLTTAGRRKLNYAPNPQETGGTVKGLPLRESARLVFLMQSGERIEVFWPGFTFAALFDEQILAASEARSSAWFAMAKAAGGIMAEPAPALTVKQADRVQLRAVPQYALRKVGRASLEEGSPFVERLNEILARGDEGEKRKLFGTARPLEIEWSYLATNLTTGDSIPVKKGKPPETAKERKVVYVAEIPGKIPFEAVQITFPGEPDAVYEVRATAKLTDAFGSTSATEHRVYSHFLTDSTRADIVKTLLPAVAAAAGVSADDLMAAAKLGILPPDDPRLRDPKVRRALVVYNFTLQAANDKRIGIDELTSLIRGAKLLGIH